MKTTTAKRRKVKKFKSKATNAWQPFDHGADGAKRGEEAFSNAISHLGDYFANGENTIAKISEDLNERLIMLLYIASAGGKLKSTIAKLLPSAKDQSVDALCAASKMISTFLIECAKSKNAPAAERIWDNAVETVSAIKTLAQTNPEVLRPRARKAIFMPSFRAKVNKFSDDFQELSDAIELSKDFPLKTGDKALYDLDGLVMQYVINMLKEALEVRQLLKGVASFLDSQQGVKKSLSSLSREQLLLNVPGVRYEHLGYVDLPPYNKETANIWWEKCIKPQLDAPETLHRLEGTKLFLLLSEGAKIPADYSIRDYLKKLCKEKVVGSLAT